jgi:hypothetical protein
MKPSGYSLLFGCVASVALAAAWAIEASDPLVYARGIVQEPANGESSRHVLMEQGIVDHYQPMSCGGA